VTSALSDEKRSAETSVALRTDLIMPISMLVNASNAKTRRGVWTAHRANVLQDARDNL
jgi:hypothetical protein